MIEPAEIQSVERNSLFDGDLVCEQNVEGYRFSIDSVLLAHFVSVKQNDRIVDLGTGCGIISLILLYRHYNTIAECSGVELQESLYERAKGNRENNLFKEKNTVLQCDIKRLKEHWPAGTFDSVVCNPPFYPQHSGRVNSNSEARLARHQLSADANDFLRAASYVVKNRGNVFFIYPAELLSDFIQKALYNNLTLKKLRFIYSYPDSSSGAQLALIQCSKNGGTGVQIPESLYIYTSKNGSYTHEVKQYYTRNKNL